MYLSKKHANHTYDLLIQIYILLFDNTFLGHIRTVKPFMPIYGVVVHMANSLCLENADGRESFWLSRKMVVSFGVLRKAKILKLDLQYGKKTSNFSKSYWLSLDEFYPRMIKDYLSRSINQTRKNIPQSMK